ncbi:hypothetical protein [Paenibacillus elgii]|uniref:hypothetical protein n=1 Tax=Paenibacillus elgii TaxID=189691 RepID=UPI000248DF8A|nr:hypothetical protein [Paenibacillus elgii]MCM3269152.1 hypothetical protein [Paenibacillus elgii]
MTKLEKEQAPSSDKVVQNRRTSFQSKREYDMMDLQKKLLPANQKGRECSSIRDLATIDCPQGDRRKE